MSFNIISNDEKSRHYDWFVKFANGSDTLVIVSPFLSSNVDELLASTHSIKKIELFTNLDGYDMTSSTVKALHKLYDYCRNRIDLTVYCNNKLHGKVYLFYNGNTSKGFIVSSGNFTENGLLHNQEYGIFSDNAIIQADLLSRIKENDYYELTLNDVVTIENELGKFEKDNPIIRQKVFKAMPYLNKSVKKVNGFDNKMILLNLKQSYKPGMGSDELYSKVRGYWVINVEKAREYKYIAAVGEDKIVEVYRQIGWYPAFTKTDISNSLNPQKDKKRHEFEGILAEESIRQKYIGVDVSKYYRQAQQQPIRYIDKDI